MAKVIGFGLAMLVIIGFAIFGRSPSPTTPTTQAPTTTAAISQSPEWARAMVELRDEGITNTGWIAGNAKGHPIWPAIRGYVGKDGDYYNAFIKLAAPGSDHATEARRNLDLYATSVKAGAAASYDEEEATRRTVRLLQIIDELKALLANAKQ